MGCVGTSHELAQRPAKLIVLGLELMAPAVPGANRLADHIIQHPPLASLHARLVNAVAEHIVVVAHNNAPARIVCLHDRVADLALIAFNVQLDAGRILFLYCFDSIVGFPPFEPVMRNGQERTAQRVEMGNTGVSACFAVFWAAFFSAVRILGSGHFKAASAA